MRKIEFYTDLAGKQPCREWLDSMSDSNRQRVLAYITRVALGGAKKNVRSLSDGVFEIKIDRGPGFRVYFAQVRNVILLLLAGGDKSTQFQDIQRSKFDWRSYEKK